MPALCRSRSEPSARKSSPEPRNDTLLEEKIRTRHPEGKSGVNIAREKYGAVREAMLAALGGGEMTHTELVRAVEESLRGRLEGSIRWYMELVKLDLLARGVIERVGRGSPQRLRLVK